MMKKGLLLFLILIFHSSPVMGEIEAIFSSRESIKESILKGVESATSTLDLAIHEIASLDMAQALLKAKQRGIKVRLIVDSKQAKAKLSQVTYLIHQGVPVKAIGGKERGVMNHRFTILDGKKVMAGSFNWTEGSEKWNYENIVILTEGEVVVAYQKEFDRLWREKRVIK
jgi:phosphatidylserine/phosphatidylglycerophosphate/cardiolipin synthase-like enzyme